MVGSPGRSSRPATGFEGNARLRLRLRRGRLRSRLRVENEAWWAARDSELADGSDMWSRPGIAGHRPLADGGETPRPTCHGEAPRAEPEGRE